MDRLALEPPDVRGDLSDICRRPTYDTQLALFAQHDHERVLVTELLAIACKLDQIKREILSIGSNAFHLACN